MQVVIYGNVIPGIYTERQGRRKKGKANTRRDNGVTITKVWMCNVMDIRGIF